MKLSAVDANPSRHSCSRMHGRAVAKGYDQPLETSLCSALSDCFEPAGTMVAADFWLFSRTSRHRLSSLKKKHPRRINQISTGKLAFLHPIYLPHLHTLSRIALDFVLFCKLVRLRYALYAVPVRQARTLPPASFRFHLAVDTLALG